MWYHSTSSDFKSFEIRESYVFSCLRTLLMYYTYPSSLNVWESSSTPLEEVFRSCLIGRRFLLNSSHGSVTVPPEGVQNALCLGCFGRKVGLVKHSYYRGLDPGPNRDDRVPPVTGPRGRPRSRSAPVLFYWVCEGSCSRGTIPQSYRAGG